MPDDDRGDRKYRVQAGDDSFQIGQMSGGTVHMPRFVARLGPWGFGGILALAVSAVAIVALVVTSGGDTAETVQGRTGVSSAASTSSTASGELPESDCELSDTSIWIEDAEKRYGPLSMNGTDYYLRRDQAAVWVRTGAASIDTVIIYPKDDNQQRQWVPLFGHEVVAICQDSNDNLFFDFTRA